MKFGTNILMVIFDVDFIQYYDAWKKQINTNQQGIKERIKFLIQEDLNRTRRYE